MVTSRCLLSKSSCRRGGFLYEPANPPRKIAFRDSNGPAAKWLWAYAVHLTKSAGPARFFYFFIFYFRFLQKYIFDLKIYRNIQEFTGIYLPLTPERNPKNIRNPTQHPTPQSLPIIRRGSGQEASVGRRRRRRRGRPDAAAQGKRRAARVTRVENDRWAPVVS